MHKKLEEDVPNVFITEPKIKQDSPLIDEALLDLEKAFDSLREQKQQEEDYGMSSRSKSDPDIFLSYPTGTRYDINKLDVDYVSKNGLHDDLQGFLAKTRGRSYIPTVITLTIPHLPDEREEVEESSPSPDIRTQQSQVVYDTWGPSQVVTLRDPSEACWV